MRRFALMAVAAAASVLAGCGSSSSSPAGSSSSSSTTKITGAPVAGASAYHGGGFAISVPSGWQKVSVVHPGRSVTEWGDPSTHSTLTVEILTGQFRTSAAQVESQLKGVSQASPADKATGLTRVPASVPHASSAAILEYADPHVSPPNTVRQLIVSTSSGRDYEVTAERVGSGAFTAASSDGMSFLQSFSLSAGS